jgi:anti-sigma factor RsiW
LSVLTPEDMTCKELVELVTEYVEGALSPAERQRFAAHLAECPPCTMYLDQMRTTIETAGRLRPDELDPEVCEQLLEAFRGWHREGT